MNFIIDVIKEIGYFYNEIAIYLLFGFFVAGLLHILFPESIIRKHLGKSSMGSVVKSTLFGIPIPLCSCGVVPVATSLKRSGASKGSIVSFLVSTPQIGADSFMITYSLIGWVFAIFRIVASAVTALIAGVLVNIIGKQNAQEQIETASVQNNNGAIGKRFKNIFGYIEYELLGSIANSLVLGIIVAGIISALIPEGFFEQYLGNQFLSMILMIIVGIPLYVCATASTPIAASLLMKGISPGAALIFLLTGPATNAVNISTVTKIIGRKSTVAYLASIAGVSLLLGYILNIFASNIGMQHIVHQHHHELLPVWLKYIGSVTLILMLTAFYVRAKLLPRMKGKQSVKSDHIQLEVRGMTCMHCAGNVKKAVESVGGASDVNVDLDTCTVTFELDDETKVTKVKDQIISAGYDV